MKLPFFHISVLLSILLFAQPLLANSEALFNRALTLYKSGDFLKARQLFLSSQSDTFNPPKLIYNLGVTNYKLGFHPSARQHFFHLSNIDRYKSLSYYNLALIAIKLNEMDDALHWLNQTLTHSKQDSNIYKLASNLQNKVLNEREPNTTQSPIEIALQNPPTRIKRKNKDKTFVTFLKTQTGYIDNIIQYSLGDARNVPVVGDSFLLLQADGAIKIGNHIKSDFSLNQMSYQRNSIYNSRTLAFDTSVNQTFFNWRYFLTGSYENLLVNNQAFQNTITIKTATNKNITERFKYRASIAYQRINIQNPIYFHLSGNKRSISNSLQFSNKNHSYLANYTYENNDRNDFYSNGEPYVSFSPRTHKLELKLASKLRHKINVQLSALAALSRYPTNDFIHEQYSRKRMDISYEFDARTSYAINRSVFLIANYRFYNNDSVFSRYRLENNIYQFGLSWQI